MSELFYFFLPFYKSFEEKKKGGEVALFVRFGCTLYFLC